MISARVLSRSGRIFSVVCTALFFASFVLAGEAAARSAALNKVIEAAKKEGELKILWTEDHMGADTGLAAIVAAMNKRYGTDIKLQFTQGRSFPANLGRLTQEVGRMKARHHGDGLPVNCQAHPPTPQSENAFGGSQQALGGGRAQ